MRILFLVGRYDQFPELKEPLTYMKKIIFISLLFLSYFANSQNSRIEIGSNSSGNNNWLLYANAGANGIFELAARTTYDGSTWSYDWSQSLRYNSAGQLFTGSFYGFRGQEGQIGFNNIAQSKIEFFYSGNSTNSGQLRLSYGTASGSSMMFGTNTSSGYENLMTLNKSAGLALLTLKGNLHSREVKVTADAGADFVFDESYELRTLEETEKFILRNKHLPEIASEAEMIENGLELGEMNIKLLQKIEELTLYMIDINKQLKAQNERMEKLQLENSELKNVVSALKNK